MYNCSNLHVAKYATSIYKAEGVIISCIFFKQMISNDRLKSVYHRVIANTIGPRISIAFFFKGLFSSPKLYGPIKELLSEKNPAIYREFTLEEFLTHFISRPLDQPGLDHFKING